jgi:hypothetical protein
MKFSSNAILRKGHLIPETYNIPDPLRESLPQTNKGPARGLPDRAFAPLDVSS